MKEFLVPVGMRDLVFDEMKKKRALQSVLEDCLTKWGYEEIQTPTIEYYKTYHVGFDDLKEEQMYKFFDNQGRILALRADMTIPIARLVATKFKDVTSPLRLRYCADVFKVHEAFAGNRNEIRDLGIECIGVNKVEGDLEILCVAMEALDVIKDQKLTLEIGDVNFFRSACEVLSLSQDNVEALAYLIDNKRLPELNEYLEELALDEQYKQFFKQIVWWNGSVDILDEALNYTFDDTLVASITYLKELYEKLKQLGYEERITFDLGKIGKLNYYTGIIFDAFVEGVGLRVMSGGRYDTLIKKYGKDLPAVGFSIKLDQLMNAYTYQDSSEKIVIEYGEGNLLEALQLRKSMASNAVVVVSKNDRIQGVEVKGAKQ